ncbi:MAG: cache domain-containing protein, partial [Bacteroidota bacterium]
MNLKLKISLFIGMLLIVTIAIISSFNIYRLTTKSHSDIKSFRESEEQQARLRLKNVVDLAYAILDDSYRQSGGADMSSALDVLSKIRFDGKEGYFWITDTQLPYPTMVMHAAKPQNKGKVMSAEKYNVVKGKDGKNLYQERVEQSLDHGDAFVDYFMVKPGEEKIYSKLSYSRHFKPMGWVISSGIYTDSIDEAVAVKQSELNKQLSALIWTTILIGLILLIIGLYFGWKFSNRVVDALTSVKDSLTKLAVGRIDAKLEIKRNDEIGDMKASLNSLIDSLSNYISFAKEVRKGNISIAMSLAEEDDLGHELEYMRRNLQQVIEETGDVLKEASDEGNLKARIDLSRKQGAWLELSESINRLLESVANPIAAVDRIINAMAEGDLSSRYNDIAVGDIKRLVDNLNKAQTQLTRLLSGATGSADTFEISAVEMLSSGEEMSRSTSEIASAIGQMSSGAQSQVSKVDEVSHLIEQILKSSNDMKDKANGINVAALTGSEKSQQGGEMLDELKQGISEIMQYTTKTHESIDVLKGRSDEISQVLTVISDIAAQTNLLALNAAIEAAQAGD